MSSVDVIVPCYNYARFLRECVGSVLGQEKVDVRVLIIDDASQDNSAEVAAELAREDARVEFRRHARNCGHIATYNEGLEWGAGDYMLLLSADDVLTPGALGRATQLMDEHPEVGFTFGRAITTDKPDFQHCHEAGECRHRIISGAAFWVISCNAANNVVSTPTAVVRSWLQKNLGGYRTELPHTGDLEMWMRFAAHASVGVVDADQAFYRVHGRNMHKETFPQAMTVLEQHQLAFAILFREYGGRFENAERLRRMATRALALGAVRRAGKLFEGGDRTSCERLLQAALQVFPEVRMEPEWSRLKWKKVVGSRMVKVMRRMRGVVCRPAPHDPSPFGRCGIFEGV